MEKKISIRVNKLIYSLIKPSSWNYYLIEKRINYEKRREEKRLIFALIKLSLYNFHNYDYQHLTYGW
jgi:hypothetical protein